MARHSFAKRPPLALTHQGLGVAEDRRGLRTRSPLKSRLLFAIGPTLLIALGATVVASAQSNSPFANKKKVNAWDLPEAGMPAPTQTNNTRPSSATPSTRPTVPGGLRLRSRNLSPETAAAPPPGAPALVVPKVSAPIVSAPVQVATAAPKAQTGPNSNAPQTMPSENYTYGGPNATAAVTANATNSGPNDNPWRPYTGPTLSSQTGAQTGTQTGTMAAPASPNRAPIYRNPNVGVSYANVPRGSVNSPPSGAPRDDTDWTVHQLSNPVRSLPGQGSRSDDMGRFEGKSAQTGNWGQSAGQNSGQSQNPTAYEYGYRRPGEAPVQTVDNSGPNNSQYGTYGGPDPRSDSTSAQNSGPNSGPNAGQYQTPQYPDAYGQPSSGPSRPVAKQGFFNRLGLNNISRFIRGALRGGVAARETDGWKEAFVVDGDIEIELSAITQGGVEWGIHGQVRGQYDEGRKGFTRRLPDCPPTTVGCPVILVAGTPTSVRGHTSQFYTSGPDVGKDTQVAFESAHLFLRSAYGDVTVGRDDGAAYLFSLGAPTLLNVGTSNSPTDYTGLDAIKTLNDASGFSEKITYTTPRLLGDQVGVGVQFGVSYALDGEACGVDYCVEVDGIQNVVTPDLEDIFEGGIALDRTFAPGVSVEATATYARGTEKSGLAGLDDLQAYGAGLEFRMHDFTLGGSYLNSNQGLMTGDYQSYDVGLTWQPSVLGFTVGYGHADDDNVGLSSDQITGGVTYDINDKIRLGAGVQYSDRDTRQDVAGTAQTVNDKATAIFIEAGITF